MNRLSKELPNDLNMMPLNLHGSGAAFKYADEFF